MDKKTFYVITDTHYFENSLGAYGSAYNEFMRYEQKCFAETQAINESVFDFLSRDTEIDTVLIAGDLSFNGEIESHRGFLKLLKKLRDSGKKIYVITAGHDYNDHPFAFTDEGRIEPEGTQREALFDLYYDYGFADALAVDKEHLSYCAQLAPGIRLLALNNDGDCKSSQTYDESQLEWIHTQCERAREDGQMMIAMNHWPLLPGVPLFGLVSSAVMKNADAVTSFLADEGVHLCFTGHMHNQSINEKITEKGNKFYDVCTGSVIGCPASIRIVTVEDENSVDIKTIPVPDFEWDMQGLTTEEYFKRQFDMMINTMLDSMKDTPELLLRKLGASSSPLLCKIIGKLGRAISTLTLGGLGKRLLIKVNPEIRERPLRDFAVEVVRNSFLGDQPYVEGTPEYETVMRVLKRFRPVIKLAEKKLPPVCGKPADLTKIIAGTIGNSGVPDNNARLILK